MSEELVDATQMIADYIEYEEVRYARVTSNIEVLHGPPQKLEMMYDEDLFIKDGWMIGIRHVNIHFKDGFTKIVAFGPAIYKRAEGYWTKEFDQTSVPKTVFVQFYQLVIMEGWLRGLGAHSAMGDQ